MANDHLTAVPTPEAAQIEAQGFPGGFTVLMAVYARDDVLLFEQAVTSVYDNTLRPDDFVLVVDGPVPAALSQAIERLSARHPLRPRWLQTNGGLASALNHGLAEVRTEWVVRADADDFNLPHRFENLAAAIRAANGELDLVGGAIIEMDRSGTARSVRAPPLDEADIVRTLATRNPFNHMTVAYRASLVRESGGYPDIHLKEDYGLWASMIARGARCANLENVLVRATAGRDMHRRRGGVRYARSEWDLQVHLLRLGHTRPLLALFIGIARASAFLLPAMLRGWVYERLLRKRP